MVIFLITEEIFETIGEMHRELFNDGVVFARKPLVYRNEDGDVVVSIDYLNNGEEWEFTTTIEAE